jgi:hypothetical protein
MVNYPEYCLRGISKVSDVTPDGRIGATAFYPDERTTEKRIDNCMETSINWEDDDHALFLTLKLFQFGTVRLERAEIDRINTLPASNNEIAYERSPQPNNPYHGNILFRNNISNAVRKMIAGSLALACSKVIQK